MFRRAGIEIKSPQQLRHMRRAGLVVADALQAASAAAVPGARTADLDRAAAEVIAAAGAKPSFLGYRGYPATICVSVNDEVVHGIPGSRVLRAGDVVSIDCGAIVAGWHGDAALTVGVGEISPELARLSEVTRLALWAGIAAVAAEGRVSDIGAAVEGAVLDARAGYGILADYVGHGIGSRMHMAPSVANFGPAGHGPRLRPGMALAIEPMVTLGDPDVRVMPDRWTVVTLDGGFAAHWEHTVAVTDEGPWVLTARDGGLAELSARGIVTPATAWA